MSTADEQAAWDGTTAAEDAEVVNAILPQMRALLAAKMLTIVERIAKRHFMAGYRRALEDAADASEDTDAMDYWVGILSEDRQWSGVAAWLRDRAAGVGTKDGDDDRG